MRLKATELVLAIYHIVGDLNTMAQYLSNLSKEKRDRVLAELEDAGTSGAAEGMRLQGGQPQLKNRPSHGGQSPLGVPSAPPSAPAVDDNAALGGDGFEALACEFCGAHDQGFAVAEKLDMHYWKDCPMLTSCEQCQQIVPVVDLNYHLVEECAQSQPFRYDPPLGNEGFTGCPLCLNELPASGDGVRQHLCFECSANPRLGVAASDYRGH